MNEMTEEQIKKQQEFLERAKKGVLSFLNEKGGTLQLSQLHEFSLNKYLIQHQRFSQLMESCVDGGLVIYDFATQDVTLSEAGKKFIV